MIAGAALVSVLGMWVLAIAVYSTVDVVHALFRFVR